MTITLTKPGTSIPRVYARFEDGSGKDKAVSVPVYGSTVQEVSALFIAAIEQKAKANGKSTQSDQPFDADAAHHADTGE